MSYLALFLHTDTGYLQGFAVQADACDEEGERVVLRHRGRVVFQAPRARFHSAVPFEHQLEAKAHIRTLSHRKIGAATFDVYEVGVAGRTGSRHYHRPKRNVGGGMVEGVTFSINETPRAARRKG